MRHILSTLLLFFVCLLSCTKTNNEPDRLLVDIDFLNTSTPKNVETGMEIVSHVTCTAENLCYQFSNFEIKEVNSRQFEIHAKAKYPNGAKGDVICLDAIYYKDTTVTIHTTSKGQYLLYFYNRNYLFKTDTVQVN